ncbi:MAG: hypothetical protein MJY99_00130 [Fibrobacter sp.]|nr:hypothetical protein [Fibrobacter sp.]
MMYKFLLSLLLVASAASATSELELNKQIKAKDDSLNAKRGLEIGGSVKGILVNSYMSSDQEDGALNKMPNVERSQFVTADLDFHFRPYDALRFNMLLRLEAGMQNYFASSAKSISAAWLNVEGNVNKDFYWVVGDFRQQYSPLTLFAPTGIDDILYEPLIFARAREMAKSDALIEGNQRNLQGVNLQFRHDFGGAAGELRAEGIFARLRRVQVLDFSGANGNLLPNGGNAVVNKGSVYEGSYQSANMDKWLLSANLEYLPMNKNVFVGFTGMYVFDDSTSFRYTYRTNKEEVIVDGQLSYTDNGELIDKVSNPTAFDDNGDYQLSVINPLETDAQRTTILAGRVGADVAGFMGNKDLTLDVMGEFAMSNDKLYEVVPVLDAEGNPTGFDTKQVDNDGMGIIATLNAGYKLPMGLTLDLSANYLMNDSAWFNNLAQSPQFFAQRILNTDKDGNVVRYGVNAPLYSTFGALYFFDPKFTPVSTQLATTDDPTVKGQTNSYNIAPYNKNSWGTQTYTRKELALMNAMADNAVQMALPNGLATANRNGAMVNFRAAYNDFAEMSAIFNMLKQDKSQSPLFKEAEFMEYGAGLKWDIFKMLGFSLPLEISGSYKHSLKTQELTDETKAAVPGAEKGELKMDFINAGLYVQYLPRLGVSAGFQMINMEYDNVSSATYARPAPGYETPLMKGNQMQWMVGLDYTIEKNVYLALNYGIITVENTYNTSAGVGQNMPNYIDATVKDETGAVTGTVPEFKHKFSQAVVEAVLNVNF